MRKFTPPYRGLLEYDFVGTPILEEEGVDRHVGKNVGSLDSGLSLRNRSMVLDIIKVSDFENESAHAHNMEISEDQWFYQKNAVAAPTTRRTEWREASKRQGCNKFLCGDDLV
jgi:hypothetical protein